MFLWKPWFQDPVMNRKFKRTVYVWNINLCNIINVFTVTFDLSFKSINLCPKIVLNSNARKKFCIIRPLILTFVVCHIKNNSVFSDYQTKLFSRRFCGGLVLDVKRKLPFYASDFYDALNIQSLSAILFIYLGTVTNAITFGGLLGDATDNMQVRRVTSFTVCAKLESDGLAQLGLFGSSWISGLPDVVFTALGI